MTPKFLNDAELKAFLASWCLGQEIRLAIISHKCDSEPSHFLVTTLGKLFTHLPVTKQYTLVPYKGRWSPAAGNV